MSVLVWKTRLTTFFVVLEVVAQQRLEDQNEKQAQLVL